MITLSVSNNLVRHNWLLDNVAVTIRHYPFFVQRASALGSALI